MTVTVGATGTLGGARSPEPCRFLRGRGRVKSMRAVGPLLILCNLALGVTASWVPWAGSRNHPTHRPGGLGQPRRPVPRRCLVGCLGGPGPRWWASAGALGTASGTADGGQGIRRCRGARPRPRHGRPVGSTRRLTNWRPKWPDCGIKCSGCRNPRIRILSQAPRFPRCEPPASCSRISCSSVKTLRTYRPWAISRTGPYFAGRDLGSWVATARRSTRWTWTSRCPAGPPSWTSTRV